MVLAVAGGFIRYQIHTLDIRQSNDELVVTRQEIYNAAKVNYFDELQSHAACLETVSRSLAQRVQWGILVDAALHANLPDLATQIENGPVLSDPPRAVSDCGPAPVKPIPGPGVTP